MKTKIIVFGLAWLLGLNHASADNFVISNVTVPQGGTAELEIGYNFTSETEKVGFALSLGLPDGLTLQKDGDGDPVYVKGAGIEKLNINFAGDNGVAGMPSNETATIKGTSGTLLTLTLVADAGLEVGAEYTIPVTKAVFQQRVSGSVSDINIDDFSFKVTVGEPVDPRTILDENSTTAPTASNGPVDVRVKRTINAGSWSSICLPFDMTEAQTKEAFGNDVQLAEFKGVNSEFDANDNVVGIKVNFNSVNSITANTPYIIKVSNAVSEFTLDGVNITPDEDEAYIEFDNGKTGSRRVVYSGFYGTYHADTPLDKNTLFLSGGKFWYSAGLTKMKAFRAFFSFLDILTEVEDAGVKMVVNIDDEETRIENVNVNDNSMIYDLSGRHVYKAQKSVYIVNGKKVLY